MSYWRVGLRVKEGRWHAADLDDLGASRLETKISYNSPGESVEGLKRELDDWRAYTKARFSK